MKAVMVMYDSLRLDYLPCYGGKQLHLPNFERLAAHTAIFDNSYVCSMPCMPARRELHTGRANFLHRSWGPIEPFDDSMPELLKQNGVYARIGTASSSTRGMAGRTAARPTAPGTAHGSATAGRRATRGRPVPHPIRRAPTAIRCPRAHPKASKRCSTRCTGRT